MCRLKRQKHNKNCEKEIELLTVNINASIIYCGFVPKIDEIYAVYSMCCHKQKTTQEFSMRLQNRIQNVKKNTKHKKEVSGTLTANKNNRRSVFDRQCTQHHNNQDTADSASAFCVCVHWRAISQ